MEDNSLDKFLQKIYEVRFQSRQKTYSDEDLKKIALDAGLSESDWNELRTGFDAQMANGRALEKMRNWPDASQSFESASSINPWNLEALLGSAKARVELWKREQHMEHRQKADEYLVRCLRIDPGNERALKLKTEMRYKDNNRTSLRKFLMLIGAGFLVLVLIIWAGMWYSAKTDMAILFEETEGKKAQLENVYQRRADLIPQIVGTVKAQADFESAQLDKLQKMAADLATNSGNSFGRQNEISVVLRSVVTQMAAHPELGSSQAFRDLRVQIEGAENRISVERKKLGESVQKYNSEMLSFPKSLFDFEKIKYFEAGEGAKTAPVIEFE